MLRRRKGKALGSAFELRFEGRDELDFEGEPVACGRILVGDFHEPFDASLMHWTRREYEAHWRAQARRLAERGGAASFVTSYNGPGAVHLTWPAWREGSRVVLHNQLLISDQLESPFDPAQPHLSVGPRLSVAQDGEPISEWETTVAAVAQFAAHGPSSPQSPPNVR